LHFAFSSIRIAANPPFKLNVFLFLIKDHWLSINCVYCFLFLSGKS
jgi:hypothetical protein